MNEGLYQYGTDGYTGTMKSLDETHISFKGMRVLLGTKACWQPNLPIGLNWSRLIKSYIDMDLNRPVELLRG